MERLIENLLEEKQNGDDTTKTVENIAKDIDKASRLSSFYSIDLTLMSKILQSAGTIESRTARRILRNANKVFSKRTILLLSSLDCGKIGLSATKIVSLFDDIPIMRELLEGIKKLQEENIARREEYNNEKHKEERNKSKEQKEINDDLDESCYLEVDWEYKYHQLELELKARDKAELEKRIAEAKENEQKAKETAIYSYEEESDSNFFSAIKNGDLETIKAIVTQNPEAANKYIGTYSQKKKPLCWAAAYGHLEIIKFLIENGADTYGLMNGDSYSPVLEAVKNHQIDVLKYFISIDAEIDYKHSPPCVEAARCGFTDIIDILVSKGVKLSDHKYIFDYPIEHEKIDVVKHLIEKGADPSIGLNSIFIWNPSEDMFAFLLSKGADINSKPRDGYGDNFMERAIRSNYSDEIVEEALVGFKYPSHKHIYAATNSGRLKILQKLLERGVEVSFHDLSRNVSLNEENMPCFRYLIEIGHKIDPSDPFIPNSVSGGTKVIQELIQLGADINAVIKDSFSYEPQNALTVLMKCYIKDEKEREEIAQFLIDHGINVNFQDTNGNTALHHAAIRYNINIIKLILKSGLANRTLKNNEGKVFIECVEGKKNRSDVFELAQSI